MSETLGEFTARTFGFNPGEVRGPDGKWIHVGANHLDRAAERATEKAGAREKKAAAKISRQVLKNIGFPRKSGARLEAREKRARDKIVRDATHTGRAERSGTKAEARDKAARDRMTEEILKRRG